MATAIINSQMDAINESFSNISSDLTTIRPLLKNASIGAYPTDTASGSIASFTDGADGIPVKSLSVNIEPIQSGSGDPSPTNIRPISGHTEVNVTRTGKNLWSFESAYSKTSSGTILQLQPLKLKAGTYTLSMKGSIAAAMAITIRDASGAILATQTINSSQFVSGAVSRSFTLANDSATINIYANGAYDLSDIQLELGSTATAYEPYAGQTYPVSLGQTVYGGTLNVTTGVLTITHRVGTTAGNESSMSVQSESEQGHLFRVTWFGGIAPFAGLKQSYPTGCICNTYGRSGTSYVNMASNSTDMAFAITGTAGITLLISDSSVASAEDMTARITASPIEVYYPLATPTTVQLTATQVSTLLGQNNIWADTGNVEVTYRADTTLYIQQLTKPDDDFTADASIASGKFFMVGNRLFISTTAISAGESIVIGTNCTEVSLADALNQLNA